MKPNKSKKPLIEDRKSVRVVNSISLNQYEAEKATRIGGGNKSKGIQIALEKCDDNT